MNIKPILAEIVNLLHYGLYIPTLIIPLLAKKDISWLKYNLLLIPLIILDWNDTDGLCSLTAIKRKLKGTSKEDKPDFFMNIINKILKHLNMTVTYEQSSKLNYLIFVFWWLYLYWTFLKLQGIKLFDESSDLVTKSQKYTVYLFIIIYVVSLLV